MSCSLPSSASFVREQTVARREREKGGVEMGCMVKKTKDKQQLLHHQIRLHSN
jgi:hypothetical protein